MTTILAFDPGGTTGVAIRMVDGSIVTAPYTDPEEIWQLISDFREVVQVVYENYAGQLISKDGLHTVRIIGGIIALCYHLQIPCVSQPPQLRRPFLENAKELLHGRPHVIHEVDALAHLLVWEHQARQRDKHASK